MRTLIVDKQKTELRYQGCNVLIYCEGKRISSIPLNQLERIVVSPHVILTAGVLGVVAEQQVPLLVLNGRIPARTAYLSSRFGGDSQRRLQQYTLSQNARFCISRAAVLVMLKLKSQQRFLKKAVKTRPDLRFPLTNAVNKIEHCLPLKAHAPLFDDLNSLCGFEGSAAAAYFEGYAHLFSASLKFNGRNRRPPKDPVNAVLSLGYTLLYQEAVNALLMQSLDPALGFFHQPCFGRDSLACDLVEPLRAYVDEWVWRWFAEQTLRLEHFVFEDDACLLNDSAKGIFYPLFFHHLKPLKRLLRFYARKVVKVIEQNYVG